jgi:hypothetical protein
MKKIISSVFILTVLTAAFSGVSYGAAVKTAGKSAERPAERSTERLAEKPERYIIFFTENADIPKPVVDKIYFSKRFCLAVPFETKAPIPETLEELVSCGKIEPAASFNPEPVFPILASVYSSVPKKQQSQNGGDFSRYVSANFESFETGANRARFGVFLKSGDVSHNILYYFSGAKLPWINADNIDSPRKGACLIDGVTVFSLYTDFPSAQKDVMKWLQSKKDVFIPVLLSKKHLANSELMSYVVDLFDSSAYIKPASPLFLSENKYALMENQDAAQFKQPEVKSSVMRKLYSAAAVISDYGAGGNFDSLFYDNAVSELVYLCSYASVKSASSGKTEGIRMFDAAYANIFRLLGSAVPQDDGLASADKENLYKGTEDVAHTSLSAGGNSVSITNDGITKGAEISAKNGFTEFKIIFESGQWNEKAAFADVYIDMNNLENAGATAMLDGVKGFLSPDSAWEYALRIYDSKAFLYRDSSDKPALIAELPVTDCSVSVPQKLIRGNPINWGYQIITVSNENGVFKIIDFLSQSSQPKSDSLNQKPFQIPAVRLKK